MKKLLLPLSLSLYFSFNAFADEKPLSLRIAETYVSSIPVSKHDDFHGKIGDFQISKEDLIEIGVIDKKQDLKEKDILDDDVPLSKNQFNIKSWDELKDKYYAQMVFKSQIISHRLNELPMNVFSNNVFELSKCVDLYGTEKCISVLDGKTDDTQKAFHKMKPEL